jgi:hypothetical protein
MTAMVWDFGDSQSLARRAWDDLRETARKNSRRKTDADAVPTLIPYSTAVTVLQQLTDGYVYVDEFLRFMVSLQPIPPATLHTVFRYLDGIVRAVPLDEVPFQGPCELADRVAGTTPQCLSLADNILGHDDGTAPNPSSWAYEAVKWHIAKRLAAVPFRDHEFEPVPGAQKADGTLGKSSGWQPTGNIAEIRYRPTSAGELLAWDNPFGPAFAKLAHPVELAHAFAARPANPTRSQVQYAMSRLSIKMVTIPGESAPVLRFDTHVRRVNDNVVFASSVTVDHGKQRPLLEVGFKGTGIRRPYRHAMEILAKIDADRSALDAIEKQIALERQLLATAEDNDDRVQFLTPFPGQVRPTMPKSDSFPVGAGAGLHHLALLREHIGRTFGDTASFVDVKIMDRVFEKQTHLPGSKSEEADKKRTLDEGQYWDLVGKPSPEAILRSVEGAGHSRLRIACLWYRPETRVRMLHGLAETFGLTTEDLDPVGGELLTLAPGIDTVFCEAKSALEHGPGAQRAAEIDKLTTQYTGPGITLAAWCETELPVIGEEHKKLSRADKDKALESIDAKHSGRRRLAQSLIPNQWLVGRTYDPFTKTFSVVTKPPNTANDHPVNMAILDLYRSCGVIDDRFERALYPSRDPYRLPRLAFAGFHVRKQASTGSSRRQPERVICATVIAPSEEPGGAWRMLGWSNIHPHWEPYALAQSHFHATDYILHSTREGTEQEKWTEAGKQIKQALIDLQDELDGLPYALIVDGHATRRMWPGLQNSKQNRAADSSDSRLWLPGTGLPASYQPVTILRMNCAQEEMFRLAHHTVVTKTGKVTERKTSDQLAFPPNRPPDHPWFLFTVPRNYSRKRHGQWKTRWRAKPGVASTDAAERRENELNAPWYSTTTREINPMYTRAGYDREALAVAAARLSHQALSWSDRTRYPAPLHAALQMDLDHPQFRRSKPTDPESLDILRDAGAQV